MANPILQNTKTKLIKLSRGSSFQKFWESLFNKSLVGMNYWGGARFAESGELFAIKNLLAEKENIVFFDVGANNGSYAKAVHSILPDSAKIYCFEPLASIYQKLCETTAEKKNIFKHNIGFGSQDETLKIHYVEDKPELTSLYGDIPERNFTSSQDVEIKTIDGFLNEKNIPKIDYLKIDVEGHELKVLEGAKNALDTGKIDFIQFEFGESMIDSRVFFRDFWQLLNEKYSIYRILPSGLREIKKYSESMEIFYCVNFLAVSKTVK